MTTLELIKYKQELTPKKATKKDIIGKQMTFTLDLWISLISSPKLIEQVKIPSMLRLDTLEDSIKPIVVSKRGFL